MQYQTNFPLNQSPISEGGVWGHVGLDWTLVNTSGGVAFGTQTGSDGFNDSYALLQSTYGDTQTATGVVSRTGGAITSAHAEVELLLRWTDQAHFSRGYEFNLAFDGSYAQIIRWPGPLGTSLGDFTYIATAGGLGTINDGDVLMAKAIGNNLFLYLNGSLLCSGTDTVCPSGLVGIGFYCDGGAVGSKYGFKNATFTDGQNSQNYQPFTSAPFLCTNF